MKTCDQYAINLKSKEELFEDLDVINRVHLEKILRVFEANHLDVFARGSSIHKHRIHKDIDLLVTGDPKNYKNAINTFDFDLSEDVNAVQFHR